MCSCRGSGNESWTSSWSWSASLKLFRSTHHDSVDARNSDDTIHVTIYYWIGLCGSFPETYRFIYLSLIPKKRKKSKILSNYPILELNILLEILPKRESSKSNSDNRKFELQLQFRVSCVLLKGCRMSQRQHTFPPFTHSFYDNITFLIWDAFSSGYSHTRLNGMTAGCRGTTGAKAR